MEHCFFFSGVGECWANTNKKIPSELLQNKKIIHSEMNKELSCKGEKENSYKAFSREKMGLQRFQCRPPYLNICFRLILSFLLLALTVDW